MMEQDVYMSNGSGGRAGCLANGMLLLQSPPQAVEFPEQDTEPQLVLMSCLLPCLGDTAVYVWMGDCEAVIIKHLSSHRPEKHFIYYRNVVYSLLGLQVRICFQM